MKPKSTLQWTELFLKQYQKESENLTSTWQEVTAVTDLLKFHASILQDSAEQRLEQLEHKVRALESDAGLAKIRSGK